MRQPLLIGRKQRLGIVLRRRGAIKRLPQICLDVVAHFGITPINVFFLLASVAFVRMYTHPPPQCVAHLCSPAAEFTQQGRAHAKINPCEYSQRG